jgi:hypothetical protein
VQELAKELKLTYPTVASALDRMKKLHIVKELTGYKRNPCSPILRTWRS